MHSSKVIVLAALVVSASGCATKTYVDERIDQRVEPLEARQDRQEARIAELTQTSSQALARAEEAGVLAKGKFLYTVVFSDDGVTFDSEQATLSDGAMARLTNLAGDLKANNQNVFLEIQGHTDATGSPEYNEWLGLQRAEAVRRHLHAHGIALSRMATISYGEAAPLQANDSAEGRARNRRVEVVVLE